MTAFVNSLVYTRPRLVHGQKYNITRLETCIFHLPYSVTNVFLSHRRSRQPKQGGSNNVLSDLNYSASQGALVS